MSHTTPQGRTFVPSPAAYSKELYYPLAQMLAEAAYDQDLVVGFNDSATHPAPAVPSVYDPMAGNGERIMEILSAAFSAYSFNGSEIEPEFAGPNVTARSMFDHFDQYHIVINSPAYGNRMCIAEGTLVQTDLGNIPIEQVEEGMLVLTHMGRWRRVLKTYNSGVKDVVAVDAVGAQLSCTADHRIWSAHKSPERGVHGIGWRRADECANRADVGPRSAIRFHYLKTPVAEPLPVPVDTPRGAITWWAIGFYVGNGSTDRAMAPRTVRFSKDATYVEEVRERLSLAFGDALHEQIVGKMALWSVHHTGFAAWIRATFGSHASHKHLPGWVLGLTFEERTALLDGWLAADGCRPGDRPATSIGITVSATLAMDVVMLAASVERSSGYATAQPVASTSRFADASNRWALSHRVSVHDGISRKAHLFDGGIWKAVRSVTPDGQAETYDLEIEEDHSFVANGIAVHNSDQYLGTPTEQQLRAETGKKPRRVSYAISLGRRLHQDNGAGMQWGAAYRAFHERAWRHVFDHNLVEGGQFILNVKSHWRGKQYRDVAGWHKMICQEIGFELLEELAVPCPGNRDGANREAREADEMIYRFRKPTKGTTP